MVGEVGLAQHSSVDPGCINNAGHLVQRVVCQLGDAHVAVAVNLQGGRKRAANIQLEWIKTSTSTKMMHIALTG
jgi:hypothetical protein